MISDNLSNFDIRALLIEVGGMRRPDESLSHYLKRVARKTGISPRGAKSAWHREIHDPYNKTAIKLREARERDQSIRLSTFAGVFDQAAELLATEGRAADRELVLTLGRLAGRLRDVVHKTEITGKRISYAAREEP